MGEEERHEGAVEDLVPELPARLVLRDVDVEEVVPVLCCVCVLIGGC